MKVYVVKSLDTNFVSSIDKIFMNKQDAERYVELQSKKYNFVTFVVVEHYVFSDANQCVLAV